MAVTLDDKQEKPDQTLKEWCGVYMKETTRGQRIVVFLCFAMALKQISSSIQNFINRPIMTYAHFDFNETMEYPSITFCREPPYKLDKLKEYGFSTYPHLTSWQNFNFSFPLDKLWEDITYDSWETFAHYSLSGSRENVNLSSIISLTSGRCHTLSPKILTTKASKESGYAITVQHDDVNYSADPPGYHVYIHYTKEHFTEVGVHNGGLVQYMFCKAGETIDMKLSVSQNLMLSTKEEPCFNSDNYSANTCTNKYVWSKMGELASCSGPWMMGSSLPPCSNHSAMDTMIAVYIIMLERHNCTECPRSCHSHMYSGSINERHSLAWDYNVGQWVPKRGKASLHTQLNVYFDSMMVSVYEQRYTYDPNLFVSDLGGSVGFLLGLSVMRIMSFIGGFCSTLFRPRRTKTLGPAQIHQNQDQISHQKKLKFKCCPQRMRFYRRF